ncbi:MAG: hypothetical protein ABII18_06790 [bacterium]|nr:hypothetical protein [bacterium]MBU1917346.1 hypothetical protein [bacterium]
MNFKLLLDEAINRGEKIKTEVLAEVLKSKAIKEIVSNKNFISAVTRIIETKDEVKKVIDKQVKTIFDVMDVPTQKDMLNITKQLKKYEQLLSKFTGHKVSTKPVKKAQKVAKKKVAKKKTVTKKRVAKKPAPKKKVPAKKKTLRKAPGKQKKTTTKTVKRMKPLKKVKKK